MNSNTNNLRNTYDNARQGDCMEPLSNNPEIKIQLSTFENLGGMHGATNIKKKFERYLDLLFSDLCSKDNGNQYKSFGLYTFIKVLVNNLIFFSIQRACQVFYQQGYLQ
jgi:hypothetical protein